MQVTIPGHVSLKDLLDFVTKEGLSVDSVTIEIPDSTPAMTLIRFAAQHGLSPRHRESGDLLLCVDERSSRPLPPNVRRFERASTRTAEIPSFDGPGAA